MLIAGQFEMSKSSTFPRTNTTGARAQRPRSFFGGSFEYDPHYGGLRPTTQNAETQRKRRPASWERNDDEGVEASKSKMVLGDLTNFSKSEKLSDMPEESNVAGKHLDSNLNSKPDFIRLNSQEKANTINQNSEDIKMEVHGSAFRDRLNSTDNDTKKAARQLYAELSSPPKKVGEGNVNVVGKLRSLFDTRFSNLPTPRMSSIAVDSTGKPRTFTHQLSTEKESTEIKPLKDEKSTEIKPLKDDKSSVIKPLKDDKSTEIKDEKTQDNLGPVTGRRRTFEVIEAERKRKLFVPPAPIKLDDLLRREAPRRPSDERNSGNKKMSNRGDRTVTDQPVKSEKIKSSSDNDIGKHSKSTDINGIIDDNHNEQPRYRIPSISDLKSEYLHNIRSGKGIRPNLERRRTDSSLSASSVTSNEDINDPRRKSSEELQSNVQTGENGEVIPANKQNSEQANFIEPNVILSSNEESRYILTNDSLNDNVNGSENSIDNEKLNVSDDKLQAVDDNTINIVDKHNGQEVTQLNEDVYAVIKATVESVLEINDLDNSLIVDTVREHDHIDKESSLSDSGADDKSDSDSDDSLSSGLEYTYDINPSSDAEEPVISVAEVDVEESPDYNINDWVIDDIKNNQNKFRDDKEEDKTVTDERTSDELSNKEQLGQFVTDEGDQSSLEDLEEHKQDEEIEENESSCDYVNLKDSIEYLQNEETEPEEEDILELPPPPSHSCLLTEPNFHAGNKKVSFLESPSSVISTYSPWEYDRANVEIDPVTASAEWELEKRVEKMDIFSVDLEKDQRGLGLSIIGLGVGTESGVEKLGIFVKSLTNGGASYNDGRIQVQDQILEVNGISLVGVTQQFAAQTLKNTSGFVRFLMGREKNKKHYQAPTSGADPALKDLEQKHNQDINRLVLKVQDTEDRAYMAENELDDLKNKFLEVEGRATDAEAELDHVKEELNLIKQKPHDSKRSSFKIEHLEKSMQEMSDKLNTSQENVEKFALENSDVVTRLKETEENCENLRRENISLIQLLNEKNTKLAELEEKYGNLNDEHDNLMKHADAYRERCERLQHELEDERGSKIGQEILIRFAELEELNREHVNEIKEIREGKEGLSCKLEEKEKEVALLLKDNTYFKQLVNKLEGTTEQQMELNEKCQIEYAVKETEYEEEIEELHVRIRELNEKMKKLEEPAEPPQIIIVKPDKNVLAFAEDKDESAADKVEMTMDKVERTEDKVESTEDKVESAEDQVDSAQNTSDDSDQEEDEVIVVAELPVEELDPDFSFIERSGSCDNRSDKLAEKNMDMVNPIPKPPRRLSRGNVIADEPETITLETKPPSPRKETVKEDVVVQQKADTEKEGNLRRQSMLFAFEKLKGETFTGKENVIDSEHVTYNNVDFPKHSTRHPELFFADLPESIVDSPDMSDDDVLSDFTASKIEIPDARLNVSEPVDENEAVTVILKPEYNSTILSSKTVENEKANAISIPDVPSIPTNDMQTNEFSISTNKDDVTLRDNVKKDPDRSSFLDSLREHPGFKSMFDGDLSMSVIMDQTNSEETADEIAKQMVEGKERDRSSSTSSSSSDGSKCHAEVLDRSMSIQLDESYLQKSSEQEEPDDMVPSLLLRLGSSLDNIDGVGVGVGRTEKSDVPTAVDINFDDIPMTPTLNNSFQYDKRNVAKALPKNIHKRPVTSPQRPVVVVEPLPPQPQLQPPPQEPIIELKPTPEQKPSSEQQIPTERPVDVPNDMVVIDRTHSDATASVTFSQEPDRHMAAEKEKRKSKFGFHFPKGFFGGKKVKKRSKSMENLLGGDPTPRSQTTDGNFRRSVGENLHRGGIHDDDDDDDDHDSIVPFSETNSEAPDSLSDEKTGASASPSEEQMKYEARLRIHIPAADYPSSEASSGAPSTSTSAASTLERKQRRFGSLDEGGRDDADGSNQDTTMHWTNRSVVDWDIRQVGLWLIGMEMEEYVNSFQVHNVDGAELLALNASKLKNLGVLNGDHRAIIKKKIRDFRDQRKVRDSKRENKLSKKPFWKGKYTVNS